MKRTLGLLAENTQLRVALLRKEKGTLIIDALHSFSKEECDKSFIIKKMSRLASLSEVTGSVSPSSSNGSLTHLYRRFLQRFPFLTLLNRSSKNNKIFPLFSKVKQLYIAQAPWVSADPILATALGSHEALFRTLTLPITHPRKAMAALPFQLETLLPFSLEEALIATSIAKQPKGTPVSISLFATKKQTLQTHLENYQTLKIDPDYVTPVQLALYRLARWLFPQEHSIHILYIGASKSCFVATSSQQVTLTQSLPFGYEDSSVTSSLSEKNIQELERLLYYLKSKNIAPENTPWVLFGEENFISTYVAWFKVKGLSLLSVSHSSLSSSLLQIYAVPIGIALEALAEDKTAVQLRQGIHRSTEFRKKRKKQLCFFLACCGLATLIFGMSSQMFLYKKQSILQEEMAQHLPSSLQPPPLSTEEIKWSLYQWEQSLGSKKNPFPFLPTTPLVSDLLAWLSTHPALVTAEGQKKEGIEVKNIRYQLYRYPKLGENTNIYAARVDLELTADTPRLAREFHDALLKGDLIVDEKKEIKWTTQHNTYWASFETRPQKPREIP